MRYGLVKIKPEGGARLLSVRLEILRDSLSPSGSRVVSGYKVRADGSYIDVDALEIYIGVRSVTELVEDWKYGELVPAGTATQERRA